MLTAVQVIQNHPTTAASGLGGSLSIVIVSILIHLNVHLTQEEAIAWSALIISFLGWFLRFLSKRYPNLEIAPPNEPPVSPPAIQNQEIQNAV